jgi:hypothetical protein
MPVNDDTISRVESERFDYKILVHHLFLEWLQLKVRKHEQARVSSGEVNLK